MCKSLTSEQEGRGGRGGVGAVELRNTSKFYIDMPLSWESLVNKILVVTLPASLTSVVRLVRHHSMK